MNPHARRMARAITATAKRPDATYRTAVVVANDPTGGYVDIDLTSEDGSTVTVERVKFQGGVVPQVGRQVSYVMNGTEPVVVSESGTAHDPVFDGSVTARSFYAVPGDNLLGEFSRGPSWDGWSGNRETTVVEYVDADRRVLQMTSTAEGDYIQSPLVPVGKWDRHYTGWVEMYDTGVNASAYLVMRAYSAAGDVVAEWGEYVDDVRVQPAPGGEMPSINRYPMPDAAEYLTSEAVALRLFVYASDVGALTIASSYIGTSPVFSGGAVLLGRTLIDQSGIRFDGEDLLSPWKVTVYSPTSTPAPGVGVHTWVESDVDTIGGGWWVVRHRRVGRVVFFNAYGYIAGPMVTTDGNPTDLPLPYVAASRSVFVGHMGQSDDRQWPVTGYIGAGDANIARLIGSWDGNDGYFGPTAPFSEWGGGIGGGGGGSDYELHVSGVYEAD